MYMYMILCCQISHSPFKHFITILLNFLNNIWNKSVVVGCLMAFPALLIVTFYFCFEVTLYSILTEWFLADESWQNLYKLYITFFDVDERKLTFPVNYDFGENGHQLSRFWNLYHVRILEPSTIFSFFICHLKLIE